MRAMNKLKRNKKKLKSAPSWKRQQSALAKTRMFPWMNMWRNIVCAAAIVIVSLITFRPVLDAQFLNWDDNEYVTECKVVRSLSWENLGDMCSSYYVGCYLPLTMMSYAVEYALFGANPAVYHGTNLLFHVFTCLLVFWLFLLLTHRRFSAIIIALLFAVHPLHVETVAWIAERKDVLCAFFYIGSLIAYVWYARRNSKWGYALSFALFVCAFLSKPMAVSLPLVLLLIDYLEGHRLRFSLVWKKLPFFIVMVVLSYVAVIAQKSAAAMSVEHTGGILENALVPFYGIVFYLAKLIAPVRLSAIYPYPENILAACWYAPVVVCVLGLIVVWSAFRTRTIVFGSLFFLVTVSPVLKVIPIGYAIAADRYMYIPSLGLFFIMAEGTNWLWTRMNARRPRVRVGLAATLTAVIALYAWLARERCHVWRDPIAMWSDTIEKQPTVPPVAYNNRGQVYAELGETEKALKDYAEAIARDTNYATAYLNRGTLYQSESEPDRALADYHRALEANPRLPEAYNNIGNLYINSGQLGPAISNYTIALTIAPAFPEAYNGRGLAYAHMGRIQEAYSNYATLFQLNPYHVSGYINRGLLQMNQARLDEALADFSRAAALAPGRGKAHYHKAQALRMKGRHKEAWHTMQRAASTGFPVPRWEMEKYRSAASAGVHMQ